MQPERATLIGSAASMRGSARPYGRQLTNDIDDPLRNDDDFFHWPAVERAADRLERERGGLDRRPAGAARNNEIRALAPIDLDRQRNRVLDNKSPVGDWPGPLGRQIHMAESRPAFLGK